MFHGGRTLRTLPDLKRPFCRQILLELHSPLFRLYDVKDGKMAVAFMVRSDSNVYDLVIPPNEPQAYIACKKPSSLSDGVALKILWRASISIG